MASGSSQSSQQLLLDGQPVAVLGTRTYPGMLRDLSAALIRAGWKRPEVLEAAIEDITDATGLVQTLELVVDEEYLNLDEMRLGKAGPETTTASCFPMMMLQFL